MFEAILLGVVQGITEFLPVSSTAHLILFPWFFRWDGTVNTLSFDVALHFGTLLALLLYFRKDWIALVKTASAKEGMLWKVMIGNLPAGVAGILLHDWFESNRSPLVIVLTLCLVSVLMIFSERRYERSHRRGIETITVRNALLIGIAQATALIPGVSRSGITIVAGIMLGFHREASARFSFLLSTPVILGASVLEAKKLTPLTDAEVNIFVAGVIASAVAGYLAIKYLLTYLREHTLAPFAYYRFLLAFVIIIALWAA